MGAGRIIGFLVVVLALILLFSGGVQPLWSVSFADDDYPVLTRVSNDFNLLVSRDASVTVFKIRVLSNSGTVLQSFTTDVCDYSNGIGAIATQDGSVLYLAGLDISHYNETGAYDSYLEKFTISKEGIVLEWEVKAFTDSYYPVLDISDDGSYVLYTETSYPGYPMKLYDANGNLIWSVNTNFDISQLVYYNVYPKISEDGNYVVAVVDGKLSLFSNSSSTPLWQATPDGEVWGWDISSGNVWLLSTPDWNGTTTYLTHYTLDGIETKFIINKSRPTLLVAKNSLAFVGFGDGTIWTIDTSGNHLWTITNVEVNPQIKGDQQLMFSTDGHYMAVAEEGSGFRVIDVATGNTITEYSTDRWAVCSISEYGVYSSLAEWGSSNLHFFKNPIAKYPLSVKVISTRGQPVRNVKITVEPM